MIGSVLTKICAALMLCSDMAATSDWLIAIFCILLCTTTVCKNEANGYLLASDMYNIPSNQEFQCPTIMNKDTVAMPGRDNGKYILLRITKKEAPSMKAASSRA